MKTTRIALALAFAAAVMVCTWSASAAASQGAVGTPGQVVCADAVDGLILDHSPEIPTTGAVPGAAVRFRLPDSHRIATAAPMMLRPRLALGNAGPRGPPVGS